MEIGKLIETRHKELGFSLEEAGNAVGVGKSTVKKRESGKIQNMRREANKLNLDPSLFIRMQRNTPCFSYGDISRSPFV